MMINRENNRRRVNVSVVAMVLVAGFTCICTGCSKTRDGSDQPESAQHAVDSIQEEFAETSLTIRDLMSARGWPGVAIAVVNRDQVLWSETFGVRDRISGSPVTSETVFSIGSITKTVTATAVMLAVQEGLVELDTPITTYLPDFSVNSRWEAHPERRMTLRHLLNHTAGFTHEAPVGNNFNPSSPSWDAHLASISGTWLKFPVGERYAYSNLGIETAAQIVQEVSGIPFETFVQRNIFEPLGMQSSFVNTPLRNGNCDACATGTNNWFTGLPTYIPMQGAGGLRMSLDDATRYVQFHLNGGRIGNKRVVESRFLTEMYRPSVQIVSFAPMLRYGLGVVLWGDFAETYSVHHQGNGFGLSAEMRWYPEYGVGMVMFLNTVERGPDWDVGTTLLKTLIEKGLVNKIKDASLPDSARFFEQLSATTRKHPLSEPGDTPYQVEWQKYMGTYCAAHGGAYVFDQDIDISSVCFRVFEQDGYLQHDGGLHPDGNKRTQQLIEHEAGLFFAEISGEALDLRSAQPTFRSIPLSKIN